MRTKKEENLLLSLLIRERKIDADMLCDGLCSKRAIQYVTKGTRQMEYSLQNRIMERMGFDRWDCEIFLPGRDYEREALKNRILHNITWQKLERAEKLLEEFKEQYRGDGLIEEQFLYAMQFQISRYRKKSREEQHRILEYAVRLTVPQHNDVPLADRMLSVIELNLMTELLMVEEGTKVCQYKEIIEYLNRMEFDETSRVKLYPKLVYEWCKAVQDEENEPDYEEMLQYCDGALELLRKRYRTYYLMEILDLRMNLLAHIPGADAAGKREQTAAWKNIFQQAYTDYRIPFETTDFCYFYVTEELYSINEVIRIRRQMLGISQQKLSEGVCTVRTLQRIEAGKSSPQRAVSTALFQRLGLSSQFIRQAYLADQLAMKDMVLRMSRLETDEEYQKEQKLFARMKEHMVEDENTNTQAVMRKDAYLRWRNGEIDLETFQAFVKEALEKTIPLDVVLKPGKRYLTDEERGCLTYLLLATEDGSGEQNSYRFVLEELYQSVPEEECYNSLMPMYNANMTQVSSICGNIGEYEKSDKIFDYIAQNSMMVRRGSQIPNVYYSNWWNDEQRRKCGIPAKYGNGREILEFAIDLAEFFDMKSSVELFKQKLR